MQRLVAALFLACVTSIASAASTSVFGIELGQPLAVPDCPFKLVGTAKLYDPTPAVTCAQEAMPLNGYQVPVRRVVFSQAESPAIVKNWTVFPLEQDGKVVGLHWLTAGVSSQPEVLEQLRAKFGPPSRQATHQVQNAAGATFDAVIAVWELPQLRVRFFGVADRITRGDVYVDLPAGAALRDAWEHQDSASERKL